MNPNLPDSAVEFATAARHAFDDLGGVDAARRAEADPTVRGDVAKVVHSLGVDDLDPRADPETACAAAVLCQTAGRVVLPYPIESMLLRGEGTTDAGDGIPRGTTGAGTNNTARPFTVVTPGTIRVDHGDVAPHWDVATLDGLAGTASSSGHTRLATRLGPFCSDLSLDTPLAPSTNSASDVDANANVLRLSWWLTLTSWRILGALERAVELAARHTAERVQFAKPLTAFQTVRFALADATVAVTGLRELAVFTLWRLATSPTQAYADALALRCYSQDSARSVLRSTQQLHGAAGLCDDYDISILVRHLQPALRLPESADATAKRLADVITHDGFDGLFPHGSAA